MTPIYLGSDNIITSLGLSTHENFVNLKNGVSGLHIVENEKISPYKLPISLINDSAIEGEYKNHIIAPQNSFTRLEKNSPI